MREALATWSAWAAAGRSVAVATVVAVAGSAPRPEGSRFLVSSDGDMAGSVSGGCVENDVFVHATEVLGGGPSRLVTYGIADEEAFEVGLACGGTIQVYIEPMGGPVLQAAARLVEDERLAALATVVEGAAAGTRALIAGEAGVVAGSLPVEIEADVIADAEDLMAAEQARLLVYGDHSVFVETLAPQPRLVVWGADEVAISLAAMARLAGFRVTVCDPRPAFALADRFPEADEVLAGWPDDLADRVPLDGRTYVVVLTHDSRVEGPLLPRVLGSPARYVGALGSRRTHRKRVERLAAQGWGEEDIRRIHGPVGLDIGAEGPAEIAVSILAEMVQARYRSGSGLSLRGREGRIHGHRPPEDADV